MNGEDKIGDYARAVVEFMDAADTPKPIPCGQSMGGAITQQLLLDFADRFEAGILIGTLPGVVVATSASICDGAPSATRRATRGTEDFMPKPIGTSLKITVRS